MPPSASLPGCQRVHQRRIDRALCGQLVVEIRRVCSVNGSRRIRPCARLLRLGDRPRRVDRIDVYQRVRRRGSSRRGGPGNRDETDRTGCGAEALARRLSMRSCRRDPGAAAHEHETLEHHRSLAGEASEMGTGGGDSTPRAASDSRSTRRSEAPRQTASEARPLHARPP